MFKKIVKVAPDTSSKTLSNTSEKQINVKSVNNLSDTNKVDYLLENESLKIENINLKNDINELNKKYFELKRKNFELEENIRILSLKNNIIIDNVEAEIWEMNLLQEFSDYISSSFLNVYDLYIPSWNIAFNTYDKELNIISLDDFSLRYKQNDTTKQGNPKLIKKINLSSEFSSKLKNITDSFLQNKKDTIFVSQEIKNLIKN